MIGPRARAHAAGGLAATALALLVAGCQRGGLPEVGTVRVAQGALSDPLREAGLTGEALERAARDGLAAAGFGLSGGEKAHRARLDVVAVRLAPGGTLTQPPQVQIAVELVLSPPPGRELPEHRGAGAGAAPFSSGVQGAWSGALADATREAASALAVAVRAEAKTPEALIADLDAPDARVREAAIRVLAERRNPAAVPALVARLADPDVEVRHRAVGALALIRDPRAVGPLIDVSREGDPAFTARLARIIGDIGGSEARGYLLTLEAGHEDGRVRSAAREALAEMDRRSADAAQAAR